MSEQSARLKLIEEKKRRIEELRSRKAARLAKKKDDASSNEHVQSAEQKALELRRYVESLVASTTSLTTTAAATPQQQRAKLDDPVEEDDEPEKNAPAPSVEHQEAVRVEVYEKSTQTSIAAVVEDEKDPVEIEEEEEVVVHSESEAKKELVVEEGELSAFVARSARLVERCLGERLVFDALIPEDEGFEDDEAVVVENYVSEVASYCRRPGVGVSACDVSTHRKDLALAAYSGSFSMQRSSFEGQVDLWSVARSVPERTLACQSAVSACAFSPHDPHLIAAGTVTGQVVCWDTRSPSTLPIHRSPLDGRCPHVGPVFCLKFVDHQIVTASNDGNCAAWTPGQLVETLLFEDDNKNPFPLSALDVVDDGDFVGFLAAADDGRVTRAPYFNQQQQQLPGSRGIAAAAATTRDQSTTIDAHFGCVTSIAAHPSASSASHTKQRLHDATGLRRSLFLTTSLDWTVKVWGANDTQWCSLDHGPHNYVTHAAWSPTNPPIFATAAADGALRVWTLPDVASASSSSTSDSSSTSSATAHFKASNYALNQLSFSDDGRRILVADLNGQAKLLKLDDHLARLDPRRDAKLDDALARKKQ